MCSEQACTAPVDRVVVQVLALRAVNHTGLSAAKNEPLFLSILSLDSCVVSSVCFLTVPQGTTFLHVCLLGHLFHMSVG